MCRVRGYLRIPKPMASRAPSRRLADQRALAAHEDRRASERSWNHYEAGNKIRSSQLGYDPNRITNLVDRNIALMTSEFFADREGMGCPKPDPIFILGMPRAGSTLIEQILASHSQACPRRLLSSSPGSPRFPAALWEFRARAPRTPCAFIRARIDTTSGFSALRTSRAAAAVSRRLCRER